MEVMLLSHHTLPGLVILCNFVATPLLELSISSHFVTQWVSPLKERKKKKQIPAASPSHPPPKKKKRIKRKKW